MKPIVPLLMATLALAAAPLDAQEIPAGPTLLRVGATRDGITVSLDSASIERTGDSTFFANAVYDFPPGVVERLGIDRQMVMQEMDCARLRVRGRSTRAERRGMPLETADPGDTAGWRQWRAASDAEAPIVHALCENLTRSFAARLPLTLGEFGLDAPPEMLNVQETARQTARTYPGNLRNEGIGGMVLLRMRVGVDGSVDPATLRVLWAARPQFGRAALRVARLMRFRPGILHGQPVPAWITIPVSYMER